MAQKVNAYISCGKLPLILCRASRVDNLLNPVLVRQVVISMGKFTDAGHTTFLRSVVCVARYRHMLVPFPEIKAGYGEGMNICAVNI